MSGTSFRAKRRPNNSFKPTPLHDIVLPFGFRLLSLRLHHVAARLNSGVRLAMNRLAKVAAILAILIAAAIFVTPFILYFGIIAGTIAAVFKHDRHTR